MDKYTKIGEYFRIGSIGKEANRIERKALEDPFLYEALEGFSVVDADHEMVIEDLQKRIRGKANRRTGRFVWLRGGGCHDYDRNGGGVDAGQTGGV